MQNSGLTSYGLGSENSNCKTDGRGQSEGGHRETNPIELTSLISTTYCRNERNKPNDVKSKFFSNLGKIQAAFFPNMNELSRAIHSGFKISYFLAIV